MNYEIHLKDETVIIANCKDFKNVGLIFKEGLIGFGDVTVSIDEFKYAFPTDKEPCYK